MRSPWSWLLVVAFAGSAMAGSLHPQAWVGDWIWADTTQDRQECHFVREFDIPAGAVPESALLRITADNSYRVFLDGRPIGQGSDWRVLIEYDLTRLLSPGQHVLAVSAVNDFDVAGLLAGLRIRLRGGREIQIGTDPSWELVPNDLRSWPVPEHRGTWPKAKISLLFDEHKVPQIYQAPPSVPETASLWQRRWFQVSLIATGLAGLAAGGALSGLLLLKIQAERVVRRERARIAGDLHDGLGGGLTQLLLLGEAARRETGGNGAATEKLARLCEQARALAGTMNESIWLINSQRDTVRDLASHLARHAESFFRDTPVRCRFEIDDAIPDAPCDLGVRRNLYLAVKEALNNALRHSGADEVVLRIESRRGLLRISIRDNGRGFVPGEILSGEGLRNLPLRAREAGGRFALDSAPGRGTTVEFWVPLAARPRFA